MTFIGIGRILISDFFRDEIENKTIGLLYYTHPTIYEIRKWPLVTSGSLCIIKERNNWFWVKRIQLLGKQLCSKMQWDHWRACQIERGMKLSWSLIRQQNAEDGISSIIRWGLCIERINDVNGIYCIYTKVRTRGYKAVECDVLYSPIDAAWTLYFLLLRNRNGICV